MKDNFISCSPALGLRMLTPILHLRYRVTLPSRRESLILIYYHRGRRRTSGNFAREVMIRIHVESSPLSDVAVVGAGPAGAATAFYLATAGYKVLLIDRQRFPRDKVCGDFVGPAALLELERLGITELPQFKKTNVIHYAALHLDGEAIISRAIPEVPTFPNHGRVIPRKILDQWIFKAAIDSGVTAIQGARVLDFARGDDRISLTVEQNGKTSSFTTRLLVGADGSASTIAKLLRGESVPGRDRILSVRAYFDGVKGPADQADLYFSEECFPGYYWLFPTGPRSANVGVGMMLETIPPTNVRLRELLLDLIQKDKALSKRLHRATMKGKVVGWPLTTYNPDAPLVDDRVMLVGDAAGLINPLNGEGIQYALISGRIAADIAADRLAHDDLSAASLAEYTGRIEREIRYDMALSNTIVQLLRNRNLNPIWLRSLSTIVARARLDYRYADIAGGILAGVLPAREALSPRIILGTLEQAGTSIVIETLLTALGGPKKLLEVGVETGRTGIDLVSQSLQRPEELLGWAFGTVSAAFELSSQAFRYSLSNATARLGSLQHDDRA